MGVGGWWLREGGQGFEDWWLGVWKYYIRTLHMYITSPGEVAHCIQKYTAPKGWNAVLERNSLAMVVKTILLSV